MEDPKTSNPFYSPQRESEGSLNTAFLASLPFHLQLIKYHPKLGAAQGGNGMFWSLGQSSESRCWSGALCRIFSSGFQTMWDGDTVSCTADTLPTFPQVVSGNSVGCKHLEGLVWPKAVAPLASP